MNDEKEKFREMIFKQYGLEREVNCNSIERENKIEEFIVVQDAGLEFEEIYYSGLDEMEAFRSYNRIKRGKRNIFKAYIKKVLVFDVQFIDTYEIIEIVK